MFLALLAVLASSSFDVPPSHWTALDLPIRRGDLTLNCQWHVEGHSSKVQILVLSRQQLPRFESGRSVRPIYMSGFSQSGRFRFHPQDSGDYVLIIDNRIEARRSTRVALHVELTGPSHTEAWTLPPERRRAVVALSLMFFGAVVVFSATQFLRVT